MCFGFGVKKCKIMANIEETVSGTKNYGKK